jgi:predicted  nucleic acid-binding Zn-ribbon protein
LVKHLRMLEAFGDLNPEPVDSEPEFKRLDALLPASILGHYDDRRRRRRRGLTAVSNGECGHCRSRVPNAMMLQTQRVGALGMCPDCSGYLFVEKLGWLEAEAAAPSRESTQ